MLLLTSLDALGWVTALAAALAAAGYLLRATYRGLRSFWRWSKKIGKGVDASVDIVQAQLTTNGGGSLLDKVNSTHTKVDDLTRQVQTAVVLAQQAVEGQERIESRLADGDERFTGIDKRIDDVDGLTKRLEVVAKTYHPDAYEGDRDPADFED